MTLKEVWIEAAKKDLENRYEGLESEFKSVVDFMTEHTDIFGNSYIGYWAYRVKRYPDEGWLLCETHNFDSWQEREDMCTAASALKEEGEPLPDGFHMLDKETAAKVAAKLGLRIDNWDAEDIDVAIQKVLLGGIVYG